MNLEVIVRRPFGLMVSVDGGRPKLWVYAKLRKRPDLKIHKCALCKREMWSGELAWRTVENALYRSVRVCLKCWEK